MAPRTTHPKMIAHAPTAPEPVQAAQIALICMKTVKASNWEAFVAKPIEELRRAIILTPEQQSILEKHRRILPYLRTKPLVTLSACDTCGRFGLVGSAAIPAKCPYTLRCDGKVTKALVSATRARKS